MDRGLSAQLSKCAGSLLAGIAGVLATAGSALADSLERGNPPQALDLRWQAPAVCPPAAQVRENVLELAEIDADRAPRLRAEGVIRRDTSGWRLELTTDYEGMTGERSLSASSCRALTDAATLMLALILNPDVELPAEGATPDRATALRLAFSTRAGFQSGVLSALGPSFALGVGLSGAGPSLWGYAGFAPPQDAHVSGSSGPGGRVWSGSAALLGCWDFFESVTFGACAGAELTRVAGRGIAVSNPENASAYWSSGLLGARGGLRLGRVVTLRLEGFALVPAQRPSLFLEEVGRVVRPDRVGARVHAGADIELQ